MKASTVAALERINQAFYSRRASEFSDTRKQPWPGWRRVLELARDYLKGSRISVLDLGCGNGRFFDELGPALGSPKVEISYLGIDASWPLLTLAARTVAAGGWSTSRLVVADLVHRPLAELEAATRFDLIVNFGLMHHVPSRKARRRLLVACAGRLRQGGVLAVSFWQFGDRERFRRRFLPWRDAAEGGPDAPAALAAIDERDLEAGDHLLAWGDAGAVRYCHFADEREAGALVAELGLEPLSSFREDGGSGNLNLYKVLRKGGH